MPEYGCYDMSLYCRNGCQDGKEPYRPAVFQTLGECRTDARKQGWVFNRDGDVTCPECARPKGNEQ